MNNLQEKLSASKNNLTLLNEYNDIKVQLDKILNKKIKGTILRSKARVVWKRGKHTNYFLNLEKRNFKATADSAWAFNDVSYRVRYHGWLVALRGKLSDVARRGMIAFCRRKGALQNVDLKQERSLLYPRKTFILWPKTYHHR